MNLNVLIRQLEEELLSVETRRTPARLAELLSEDFLEFTASGAACGKQEVLSALSSEDAFSWKISQFSVQKLAPSCALATYELTLEQQGSTRTSLRSSIWVKSESEWQIRFHQGTPKASTEADHLC